MSYGYMIKKDGEIIPSSFYPTMNGRLFFEEGTLRILIFNANLEMYIKGRPFLVLSEKPRPHLQKMYHNVLFDFYDVSKYFKNRLKDTIFEDHQDRDKQILLTFDLPPHHFEILYGFGIGNTARKNFIGLDLDELAEEAMVWPDMDVIK